MALSLDQQLDFLIEQLPEINSHKQYWPIRTPSGTLYETFRVTCNIYY